MAKKIASGWIDILAPLKGLRDSFSRMEKDAKRSGDQAASGFGESLKKGLAAAAGVAGAIFANGLGNSLEKGKLNDKLAASLGATPAISSEMGKAAGTLYADAYGESLGDVSAAVGAVKSTLKDLVDTSGDNLTRITSQALDFASAFDQDISGAVNSAGIMINSGLVRNADEAFDLMTAGLQRVPEAMRGDVLDAMNEYGKHFAGMGLTGSEAMSLIISRSGDGAIAIDKIGDAIKEFTERGAEMSKASEAALAAAGVPVQETARLIAAGGAGAKQAMKDVAKGLLAIEDPAMRSAHAVALFGTPVADLSLQELPRFLSSISNVQDGMGDISTAAEDMGATLNDNAATKIESFRRKADGATTRLTEGFLGALVSLPGPIQDVAAGISGMGGPMLDVVAGVAPMIGGLMTMSAAQTTAAGTSTILSTAMAAIPFVAIGLAVAALAVVIYKNWDTIKSTIGNAVSWITSRIGGFLDFMGQIPSWIGSVFASVGEFIYAPFRWAFRGIAMAWNNTIGGFGFDLPSIGPFGGASIRVPMISLQGLANGGQVTSAGMFEVGERGRETVFLPAGAAVSPLPMSSMNGGSDAGEGIEVIQLVVDGRVLTEIVRDRQADIDARNAA